jgi:hypothetical protein
MLTLKKIVQKLEDLADDHRQISDFYFGDPGEFETEAPFTYPVMGAWVNPGTIGKGFHRERLTLYFADLVKADESNETHVLSDMRSVAMGIYSQLKQYFQLNKIQLIRDAELSPFWNSWGSDVAGWQLNIVIEQFFEANSCAEPSSFVAEAETSGYVRIYNSETGATVDTVNPGGEYPVLVFSGIHGGTPSTTYTNSIVGGTP